MYATKIRDWKVKVNVSWTSQAARPMIKKEKERRRVEATATPACYQMKTLCYNPVVFAATTLK